MKLSKNDLKYILAGSSLLGTGGGGRLDVAEKIFLKIQEPVEIVDINNIKGNALIVTVFGVGSIKKQGDFEKTNRVNLEILTRFIQKKISYLIPVEIGPVSVLNTFLISSSFGLPIINGDIVGYRSSPEIFLEGISLNKVNRSPIVASNSEGDSIILYKTNSYKNIEIILRNFSSFSKTKVYVAGYPIYKKNLLNYFGQGSITYSLEIGKILLNSDDINQIIKKFLLKGINFIDKGTITQQQEFNSKGFSAGKLIIKSNKDIYEIIYKNEFLICLKNDRVYFTCPDLILLYDINKKYGISNAVNNIGKQVAIFSKKSQKYWRTPIGKRLFSPRNLGFDYQQKLI